ncbi:mucin-5AC-like isoform X2 [Mizuhopecten yessoensis]|uniref:mucin-5AC-like isoform X2 n=1 Tax=Mizuhopecten yessoensis TaxID=6573 RepID=UPI000B45F51B|nr:mucin-5AC-like isoform X2 [Mizuhopecten yessoensis]
MICLTMMMVKRSWTFVHVLLLGLVVISTVGLVTADQSNCQLSFPEMTSASEESHANVTESHVQNCDIYSNILSMMEELNIITIKTSSCYAMKWISRQVASKSPSDRSRGITITFQIEEHFDSSLKTNSSSGQAGLPGMKSAGSVTTTICHSSGVRPGFKGQQSMAMVHVNSTGENGGNSNASAILVPTKNNGDNKKDPGLSHTQVVVIATCSAVIGTFFIVAAVLRIRNYMKRWREQQIVAPPDYHPCLGQPPRGPQKEAQEAVSRESNAKTANRQSSSTVKGGNRYYPVNNHGAPSSPTMSPKHCFLDSNPVLVVTAPSPIPPSPSDSHASIQFIDEEADKDITPQPCPAAEAPVEKELSPVKSPSPISVDSISSEGEVCNEDMPNPQVAAPVTTAPTVPVVAAPVTTASTVPVVAAPVTAPTVPVVAAPVTVPTVPVVAAPVTTAPTVPVVAIPILAIEPPPSIEKEQLLGNRSDSVTENTVIPSQDLNAMMSFDTSPTDASSPSDVEMVSPELLFVTAGLTQSDESLSCSHNASYSYGNQVEYSNSLYNMDDCLGNYDNEVDMDTSSTTPDEDLKQNGSSVTSEAGNMNSNGLASDDPSSSLSSPPSSPLSENTAQTYDNNTQNNTDSCGNLINLTSLPDNLDIIRPTSLPSNTQTDITDNGSVQSEMNLTRNGAIATDNRACET